MFFLVSFTIRKWPNFHEIIRNFSMQICTKFRGISRNSVTCYTNFINNSAQTTFSTHSQGVYDIQYTRNFVYFECFFLFRIPYENILFGSGFEFQFFLFLYSFNTKYSPRFQRHLLLVTFLFEGLQNLYGNHAKLYEMSYRK